MKPKNALTLALLLFVAASIVVLTVKSLRQNATASSDSGATAAQSDELPKLIDGVIAYYFHGNTRCVTCETIEAYAHEAIEKGFADELRSGRIQWRVVNYEQPQNTHFTTDYDLIAPTVVLVEMAEGKQKRWKNLVRVWELVGEKEAFVDYVQEQTRAMVGGGEKAESD